MRALHCTGALALCLLATSNLGAQCAPDVLENFTSFTEIDQDTFSSPTDTGQFWKALPKGPTSTVGGFESDPISLFGPGLTFSGDETTAMIEDGNFPASAETSHQLAFAFQYTPTQLPARGATFDDVTELVGAVPADANLGGLAYVNYVLGVGRLEGFPDSLIVFLPLNSDNQWHAEPIAAAVPDQWHTVVIQYKPSSTPSATDGAFRMWLDPTSPQDPPTIEYLSNTFITSCYGHSSLARFAFGNSSNVSDYFTPFPPGTRTRGKREDRAGTSKVKIDRVGGWNGTSEGLRGSDPGPSLADALCFLNTESLNTSWMLR